MEHFHSGALFPVTDLDNVLSLKLKQEIKQYSLENRGKEIGGVIIQDNSEYKFLKCKNISYYPEDEYILSPLDYIFCSKLGKIVGIVHSQPSAGASLMDSMTSYNHNVVSIIYSWEQDSFFIIEPSLKDYLYKDFQIGVNDCYELVKNYYLKELGIDLPIFERGEDWYLKNPYLIYENIEKSGFVPVKKEEIIKNDLILFGDGNCIGHLSIALGNNLMLHHPRQSKSVIEDINIHWRNKISLILRHKSLL